MDVLVSHCEQRTQLRCCWRGDGSGQKDLCEELAFVSRCSDNFLGVKEKNQWHHHLIESLKDLFWLLSGEKFGKGLK